jgi:hypothetical protein
VAKGTIRYISERLSWVATTAVAKAATRIQIGDDTSEGGTKARSGELLRVVMPVMSQRVAL